MKMFLWYLLCLVMLAYLIVAFIIGMALWVYPLSFCEHYLGHIVNPFPRLIFQVIPSIATGAGLVYLAQLPLRHFIEKISKFFDN